MASACSLCRPVPFRPWFPKLTGSQSFVGLGFLWGTSRRRVGAKFFGSSSLANKRDGCLGQFFWLFRCFSSFECTRIVVPPRNIGTDQVGAGSAAFQGRTALDKSDAACSCKVTLTYFSLLLRLLRGRRGSGKCQSYQQYRTVGSPMKRRRTKLAQLDCSGAWWSESSLGFTCFTTCELYHRWTPPK